MFIQDLRGEGVILGRVAVIGVVEVASCLGWGCMQGKIACTGGESGGISSWGGWFSWDLSQKGNMSGIYCNNRMVDWGQRTASSDDLSCA
jgi:hypothetical protein